MQKFKILLIGDSGSGKSSFMRVLEGKTFDEKQYTSTIGVDYAVVDDTKHNCQLRLWDTAGSDRFLPITSQYFSGTDAILVFYDLSNPGSYSSIDKWLLAIDKYQTAKTNPPMVFIVGSKADLCENTTTTAAVAQEEMYYGKYILFRTSCIQSWFLTDMSVKHTTPQQTMQAIAKLLGLRKQGVSLAMETETKTAEESDLYVPQLRSPEWILNCCILS
jgi:small GTP-binding protein